MSSVPCIQVIKCTRKQVSAKKELAVGYEMTWVAIVLSYICHSR